MTALSPAIYCIIGLITIMPYIQFFSLFYVGKYWVSANTILFLNFLFNGCLEYNVIIGVLAGLGLFIFAGVSGFGFSHEFLREFCFTQGKYTSGIFMI